MIGLGRRVAVYPFGEAVDMRKSYDTLAALVREHIKHDVLAGALYVFVGKDRRRGRVLFWDGTGLCVLANTDDATANKTRDPMETRSRDWGSAKHDAPLVGCPRRGAERDASDGLTALEEQRELAGGPLEQRFVSGPRRGEAPLLEALEREQDREILRQAARLLEAENRRMVARVMELTTELLKAQGKERAALQLEIEKLQAQLEKRNRLLFGKSSERRASDSETQDKTQAPQRGHGPREQKQLRVVIEPHNLDDADRSCRACGGALEEMGQAEETEEIDVVAPEFVLKKHICKKYRCRCGACIETAPMPPRLVPGGRYGLDFAVAVAISKYADHLPLERQSRIMKREGLEVQSHTLYDQIERLARVLWPVYDRIGAELLEEPVLFVDETPWPLLGKGESSAKWYAWLMASEKAAYYEIHDTRGLDAGKSLLAGFKGCAVTDDYVGLEKRCPGLRIAQCWAHIRRNFVACETAFPKETEQILALIRELYA